MQISPTAPLLAPIAPSATTLTRRLVHGARPRQLELVVRMAELGTVQKAAHALGMSQPSASRVRKSDVIVAKNYLSADEVDTLNRLVVIFLEQAELRVKDRQPLTLDYWRQNVDRLLRFNDKPILQGSGKLSNESAKQIAHDRYDSFDAQRRKSEAQAADAEDLKALEAVAKKDNSSQ